MTGPDLHPVGQVAESLERSKQLTRASFHCIGNLCRFLKEIGASYITYKNKIACDNTHGLICTCGIGNKKRYMLRCVSRSVHNLNAYIAHGDYIAVAHEGCAISGGKS